MSELLIGLTMQPDFPREDLIDTNASMLELMMANLQIVREHHKIADALSFSFRIGHSALMKSSLQVFDDKSQLAALHYGITVFEAVAASVGAGIMRSDTQGVIARTHELTQFDGREMGEYHEGASEDFALAAPRTAEVVKISALRFHKHLATYALIGAASSWRFEQSIPT